MEINQEKRSAHSIISLQAREIVFADSALTLPCYVSQTQRRQVDITDLSAVTPDNLSPFITADEINILIIGTDKTHSFMPAKQQIALQNLGIGVEIMTTQSACDSYNLLLSDQRQVGLLLL